MTSAAPLPTDKPLPTSTVDLIAELERLRIVIAEADEARLRRLELWLHARTMDVGEDDQRLTFARLASASGLAEPYVIREVGKAKPKPAKTARPRAAAS